jgi:hypothetical protein
MCSIREDQESSRLLAPAKPNQHETWFQHSNLGRIIASAMQKLLAAKPIILSGSLAP